MLTADDRATIFEGAHRAQNISWADVIAILCRERIERDDAERAAFRSAAKKSKREPELPFAVDGDRLVFDRGQYAPVCILRRLPELTELGRHDLAKSLNAVWAMMMEGTDEA